VRLAQHSLKAGEAQKAKPSSHQMHPRRPLKHQNSPQDHASEGISNPLDNSKSALVCATSMMQFHVAGLVA
jgi:hypothetical protein